MELFRQFLCAVMRVNGNEKKISHWIVTFNSVSNEMKNSIRKVHFLNKSFAIFFLLTHNNILKEGNSISRKPTFHAVCVHIYGLIWKTKI